MLHKSQEALVPKIKKILKDIKMDGSHQNWWRLLSPISEMAIKLTKLQLIHFYFHPSIHPKVASVSPVGSYSQATQFS